MYEELDDMRRKIRQKEIEEMAHKKEDDKLSRGRLEELKKELAEEKEQFNAMKYRWEAEKGGGERKGCLTLPYTHDIIIITIY